MDSYRNSALARLVYTFMMNIGESKSREKVRVVRKDILFLLILALKSKIKGDGEKPRKLRRKKLNVFVCWREGKTWKSLSLPCYYSLLEVNWWSRIHSDTALGVLGIDVLLRKKYSLQSLIWPMSSVLKCRLVAQCG